ncbi:porphobilinogen synthase [Lyticum sinuosum]|uniref:Delta-aminolevulinic acid dehydratase n=1 Tax=Lyticum sinuosum TaxID=1332059 RepID=A0AAE5AHQ8_9RICK|nr:porphobilinogen synthase [Lyticum sinuosum]MDZ5761266.1 Delta-aminolevulinic acid dehydratase [Lyticum sinuosum]
MINITQRQRRYRINKWIRKITNQLYLTCDDVIYPIFIHLEDDILIKNNNFLKSYSIQNAIEEIKIAYELGISALMLFPIIPSILKDDIGSYSLNNNNFFFKAIKNIKDNFPEIGVIVDVALDPYTSHGHDGIINSDGILLNDQTVVILANYAKLLAEAGADVLAPSDMTDGRVKAIRNVLDENGYNYKLIFSYSAKYASSLYMPFRDHVGSYSVGDKFNYQLDPRDLNGSMRKIKADIDEGADAIIIKPASFYLDIIYRASIEHNIPIIAYQVSGEYAMMKCAAMNNMIDYEKTLLESMISFKRAGACACITYSALDYAKNIKKY